MENAPSAASAISGWAAPGAGATVGLLVDDVGGGAAWEALLHSSGPGALPRLSVRSLTP